MTKRTPPYSPEVRARAVRMVLDHHGEHASEWAAFTSIVAKIGCSGETLRNCLGQSERDKGLRVEPICRVLPIAASTYCRNRKVPIAHDALLYKQRNLIERMFGRLKDWRRIATRYDRCAHTCFSAICIAVTVIFWL